MILAIKTSSDKAELYLLESSGEIVDEYSWEAGRTLADTLLSKIEQFLKKNKTDFRRLEGICVFSGEGSFTGLRIGTTVANTLAYLLNIKVFKCSGEDWLKKIPKDFLKAKLHQPVVPDYDKKPNITNPKS